MTGSPDVLVVGLGGMGSAACAALAARGLSVRGLERFGPAHDRGSSHGGSRIVRQAYFEGAGYVPLLLRAYELWEELGEAVGGRLLHRTGGLYVGPPDCPTVGGTRAAAVAHGLPHEVLDASEVRRRWPAVQPRDDHVALWEEAVGYVRPEAAVSAHLDVAARHGADLRFGQTVGGWSADARGVEVTTTDGSVHRAGRLVLSPGPWAPDLLADLDVPFVVTRQVQHWFDPVGGLDGFAPGQVPVWIAEDDDGVQVYGFPALDGPDGGVKCALFREGRVTTADEVDRGVSTGDVEEVAVRLAPVVPRLAGTHLRGAVCLYTNTPDHHPVLAPHPEHAAVVVAAGFSGHGFELTPVVGEVLADLVVDGGTRHPVDLFRPTSRRAPAGSPTVTHGR